MRSTRCQILQFPEFCATSGTSHRAARTFWRAWSFLRDKSGVGCLLMRDSPTSRRTALQALLALGGGLCTQDVVRRAKFRRPRSRRSRRSVGRARRSRTAVRRTDAPRSHRPRDDPREGEWQRPVSFRDRHRCQPLDAGAAPRARAQPQGLGGPQRHAQRRHRRRRSSHGGRRQPRDRRAALREAGSAGHLHIHHGQCRRHPRRRGISRPAHRRRLQARSRERARVERQAASLQHGDRARHAKRQRPHDRRRARRAAHPREGGHRHRRRAHAGQSRAAERS